MALHDGMTPAEALVEGNKHNRDKSRSPMQWDTTRNAGFSTGKPWIKVQEDYKNVNVQESLQQNESILNTYKNLITMRNSEPALQYGSYERLEHIDGMILFTRTYAGAKVTVVVNFGKKTNIEVPSNAKILMGSNELEPNGFLIYRQ